MRCLKIGLSVLALCFALSAAATAEDQKPPADAPAAEANTPAHPEDEAHSFTGTWDWHEGDSRLTLSLQQQGAALTGYHTLRHLNTGLEDGVAFPQPPSITGEVHGPIVVARFKSGQPGNYAYGHVRLTLRDRYLYWQLMDSTGTQTLPQNVVLLRRAHMPGE